MPYVCTNILIVKVIAQVPYDEPMYERTLLLIMNDMTCIYDMSCTNVLIDHFTVVCLVPWPLRESEAGVDFVLIQTFLLFLCKSR